MTAHAHHWLLGDPVDGHDSGECACGDAREWPSFVDAQAIYKHRHSLGSSRDQDREDGITLRYAERLARASA